MNEELTTAQEAMRARHIAEPSAITVTVRRDGTKCWVGYLGDSEALDFYIAVQAHIVGGKLHTKQPDKDGHLSEWHFTSVRAASRFTRELDDFEAPAVDTSDGWAAALKKQLTNQMDRTWETEEEFMDRISIKLGGQAA